MDYLIQECDVYESLRYYIMTFKYIPGQRISSRMLSNEFKIGITPAREAILSARKDGLVVSLPRSGTYVTLIDMDRVLDGRFVRESIEKNMMLDTIGKMKSDDFMFLKNNILQQRNSMKKNQIDDFFRLDNIFHEQFYMITEKEKVWEWIKSVNMQLDRFRRLKLIAKELSWSSILEQHTQILQAVREREIDDLEFLISKHLRMVLKDKDIVYREFPDYFKV